jgi:hypothetical protein
MRTTIVIGVIAAFFGVAQATTYAQFWFVHQSQLKEPTGTKLTFPALSSNDNACNDGCGESVSVDNPGCLNENGRQSIKFHVRTGQSKLLSTETHDTTVC